jgi:hypothetical protein
MLQIVGNSRQAAMRQEQTSVRLRSGQIGFLTCWNLSRLT